VKHFCNARNAILNIQDIKIINAFRDGVTDIKTIEEIAMKKPKIVADLLFVADECIEASEAQARLLDTQNKGSSKKKQQEDYEVNTADHGNRKQPDQKETRPFRRPTDAKKWCEIHLTSRHDLEECKTYLDRKKKEDKPTAPKPHWGDHHWANSDNDEQLDKINMIFKGNLSIASKTQGKKLECEINPTQQIEPGQRMSWSDTDISFEPEDHPKIELSNRNLPFVVKLPIRRHKVAKTLLDNGASLNLIMRKTFIEMGLSLSDLTPIHDTFHDVIPGQLSTPIRRIDLEVSCGPGDDKRHEILTFEVASIDIGYNCILGRPFLLKFMAVIHTAYTVMKMPGPKGVITIEADQLDALACESASLAHAGRFNDKVTQDLAAKAAKTHGGSAPQKTVAAKPSINSTPRTPMGTQG
jgi:hypothetical protein